MAEIQFDTISWTRDGNNDIMPLLPPKPFNYPAEDDVLLGIVYGFDDQYLGVLSPASPPAPIVTVTDVGDGSGFLVSAVCAVGTENSIYYRHVAASSWTLAASGIMGSFADIPVDAPSGIYVVRVLSELGTMSSDGFATVIVTDPTEVSAQYRVVAIESIGNSAFKRAILERVEKPIHPKVPAGGS